MDNGIKLGPYKILEPLGAGGMGEVQKARDTLILNRVLQGVFAPDSLTPLPEPWV